MTVTTIGLDIAKQVFQVQGVDEQGKVVLRRRLRREQVAPFFANSPPCLVGLEACGGAHIPSGPEEHPTPQFAEAGYMHASLVS